MAESYTVLARRYRSQTFDELVGQEAVAQTLKNAITSNRVAHAFLFTGTRGVGKTSAARILAKAINCPNRGSGGGDGNPCGKCNSCKAVAVGEDMDVIEIDGASNNNVEQVRELRQSAGIRPARSPYKIYIIDEVHMLSGGAFNALLKTLEEPPAHVKFIFATTDVHKVPATIISRCQRFDFKNIPTRRIAEHLKTVCQDEHIQADDEAVFRIARLGNGSMRDALSILDRVLSLGQKHITDRILEELLGKPPTAAIAELVGALADADAAGAITKADALLKEGMGVEQVLSELIDFCRYLMIVAACGNDTELLDVPAESRALFTGLAGRFDTPTLVHTIALCDQTLRSLKSTTMHRPLFDALIVRLALAEQFSSIRQLIADTDATSSNPPIAGQKKSDTALNAPPRALASGAADPMAQSSAVLGEVAGTVAPPAGPSGEEDEHEESIYEQMKATMRRQKEELDAQNAQLRQQQPQRGYGRPGPGGMPAVPAVVPVPVEMIADLSNLAAIWQAVRKHLIASGVRYIEATLGQLSRIESLDPGTGEACLLIPALQRGFANEKTRIKIEESIRAVTGRGIKVRFTFPEPSTDPEAERAAEASRAGMGGGGAGVMPQAQRISPETQEAVEKAPVVQELMKRLDARIVSIEPLNSDD